MKQIVVKQVCLLATICAVVFVTPSAAKAQFVGIGVQGGYGWLTSPVVGKEINNAINSFIPFTGDSKTKATSNGAVNVGVHVKLSKFLIGAVAVFETVDATKTSGSSSVSTRNKYATYMGRVQWNYFGAVLVHFYGGLAAGVANIKSTVTSSTEESPRVNDKSSTSKFAYQLTPLGVSVGKKISAFGEVGYGYLGIFNVGVRLTL